VTIVETKAAVRSELAPRRSSRIALVPTMGYLHEGHLSLVDRAREVADFVVLSIFVNPLQFGPGEDLATYPRDPDRDAALARERGVDLVFAPSAGEMYAGEPAVRVVPVRMADRLCGAFRPGHFEGVLTVVAKLFNVIQPDVAVFGQKDYQQAVLIRAMVRDLDVPVEIEVAPTVREPDGLAMSSRNEYLDDAARHRATRLWQGLRTATDAFRSGEQEPARLCGRVEDALADAAIEAEYVELVNRETLEPLELARPGGVLAVAAVVDGTRLIDNIVLE